MSDHYAVEVWRNGESVVRIETNCLGGREISPEDEQAIRDAAHSLLGFIGDPHPTSRDEVAAPNQMERLKEIRERHAKATQGPWSTEKPKPDPALSMFSPVVLIAATGPRQGIYADPEGGQYPESDRQFIAHAWEDIRFLLEVAAPQLLSQSGKP